MDKAFDRDEYESVAKNATHMQLFFRQTIAALAVVTLLSGSALPDDKPAPAGDIRERAWSVLTEGLKHDHAARRRIAVQALSLIPKNRRTERFATSALKDKEAKVRAAAATTLGQLHATASIPALREALNDSEVPVVLSAAQALYLMKDPSAFDIYYAVLMRDRKSSNGLVQSQVDRLKDPKQMMLLGLDEGLGFVPFGSMSYEGYKEIKRGAGSSAREASARFLAHDPDPASEDALVQAALADSSEPVRLAAIDALTERGDAGCIARLEKNLFDDKPVVRYRTAAAILHLSDLAKPLKK
jgi:HEAT repeat protein